VKLTAGLVFILPLLAAEYSTYIGDQYPRNVSAMATDAAGNTYITGWRVLAQPSAIDTYLGNSVADIFLTKLDLNGAVVFTVALGAKGADRASAIALDPAGNIYVAGSTTSNDFPLSKALQTSPNSGGSGFVVKFSPDGGTILYSTYFGGTLGTSGIAAIATDSKGNLYLTGTSNAPDFPVTAGLPDGRGKVAFPRFQGMFAAEISASGDKILFGSLLVGTALTADASSDLCRAENNARTTAGVGIAVDAAGNAYFAGNSNTIDLPATSGALVKQGVGAFVAKINSGGAGLGYLTYLDATGSCSIPVASLAALAVDAAGNAYLAGSTTDPNFPVTAGAAQTVYGGRGMFGGDALVATLKPDGSALGWSTFLGGADADEALTIAVDAAGAAWVTGTTASANFPNANGWGSGMDFLVGVNRSGSAFVYAARYPKGGTARAVALGPAPGLVMVAGSSGIVSAIATSSTPSPRIFGITSVTGARLTPVFMRGYGEPVTGRIAPGELISIYGPHIGPAAPAQATFNDAGFLPTTLAGVSVTIAGVPAPLSYASDSRIDAVVPIRTPAGLSDIAVTAVTPRFKATTVATAPAIFLDPSGFAAALNQDGTLNSSLHPAPLGSIVSIWVTGTGENFFPLADGQLANSAQNNCPDCQILFEFSVIPVTPLYAGNAPGTVAGVTQINVRLPAQVGSSVILPVTLTVNGATATANIWIAGFAFGGIL
jgi:uncharacterized protein (TIGR03437 family)